MSDNVRDGSGDGRDGYRKSVEAQAAAEHRSHAGFDCERDPFTDYVHVRTETGMERWGPERRDWVALVHKR